MHVLDPRIAAGRRPPMASQPTCSADYLCRCHARATARFAAAAAADSARAPPLLERSLVLSTWGSPLSVSHERHVRPMTLNASQFRMIAHWLFFHHARISLRDCGRGSDAGMDRRSHAHTRIHFFAPHAFGFVIGHIEELLFNLVTASVTCPSASGAPDMRRPPYPDPCHGVHRHGRTENFGRRGAHDVWTRPDAAR
jgi:hypothetical protein